MVHIFGEFELDENVYELRHHGQPVEIEPKAFDMLAYLLHHRARVVTRQELLEALWPGEHVSDASLSTCIKAARRAVRDDGTRQKVIMTLHGRGYRFVAPIVADRGQPAVTPTLLERRPPEPEMPSCGALAPPPFVGRERELEELSTALETALSGQSQLVMLVGEPGIGKTRTAEQLAVCARHRNAQVLVGRCHEGNGAPAFWPWLQLVRAYLRKRDTAAIAAAMGAGAADIAQIAAEVGECLSGLAPPPALEPEQARFRLFDSLATFLRNVAKHQALLLILDDLHWADKASLSLLQFVARQMDDARLLIVGTYRDVDLGREHALTQALGELARARSCRRIALRGLSEDDVACFIANATGSAAPAPLVAAVHRESEGNPFFMTEIVRLLVDGDGRDAASASTSKLTIPQTVREAIARRLDQLSAGCNQVLQRAAVIGREFDLNTVRCIDVRRGSPATHLLAAIDEARAARIIEAVPLAIGRYRFSHALIRDAIYDGLGTAERVRLHRRAGEAIEHLHRSNLSDHLPVLAHHFFQAAADGSVRTAIDYAVRAAEWSTSQLAYEAAVTHYESALQLLEGGAAESTEHCELLLALGHSQWRAHETLRARETFQRAAAMARQSESAEQFGRAALGLGGDALRGFEVGIVDPALVDLLEEALRRLGSGDSPVRARVLARLAVALFHEPDSLERRASLSQQAVEMASRSGDAAARLAVLYSRHWAIWSPDSLDDRLGAATHMVQLATQLKDKEMALHAHRFCFMDHMEDGAIAAADAELEICGQLAETLRQPYYLWYVRHFRALRAFLEGRFDESEQLAHEAAVIGQRANNQNVSQIVAMQLFAVRREQGRFGELEAPTRALVAQYPTLPAWRAALALICAETGNVEDARTQFDFLAGNDFGALPRDTFWLAAMAGLADVCATIGDVTRAAVLFRVLAPYASRNVMMAPGAACSGSAARPLGRLAALMERWDDARVYFEEALGRHARYGARHFVAHTERDFAEMLLRRGAVGDQRQALELLTRAHATYADLGMQSFCEKVQLLTQQAASLAAVGNQAANGGGRRPRGRITVLRPR